MRVVFMGSPEFAVLPLEHLVRSRYNVVAVYTRPDRPVGRGRALGSSAVTKAATALGLNVVQPASLKEAETVAELRRLEPELIVVAAFGRLLPQSVLAIPRYGCLNIHPSLLPRFRGASPIAAAILAGDEFTGVSIMLMDEGMDTGPVLVRAQIPISGTDTTGTLTAKLSRLGGQLLLEVLPRWLSGELSPQPQDETLASYCRPIPKQAGEINWELTAASLWRQVRAYSPWPGSFTTWQGRRLRVIEAVPLPGAVGVRAGQVVALAGGESAPAFGVATGEGILGVLKVQLAGKRVVGAADFLRGQRGFIGVQLGLS